MEITAHQDLPVSANASAPHRTDSNAQSTTPQADNEKTAEQQLVQQEIRIIQQLKARDQEVRAHEAAHLAAGRPYVVSGPSYTFQRGPDGRNYAVGGEVQLDTSPVADDPQATLKKAETVRRAALAPVDPSAQDQSIAASATQTAAQARVEIAAQRREATQIEEPEVREEEPEDAVEATGDSDGVITASTSQDATAENNQAEADLANASVIAAFNIEISLPPSFSQFA